MRRGGRNILRPERGRTIVVAAPSPPTVTNPGRQVADVGSSVTLAIEAANTTSYEATGLPAGLTINSATGVITGTPTTVGKDTVLVTVHGAGGEASATFEWAVEPAAVELGPFGERLVAALGPWMTPSLEIACAAIASMGFNQAMALIEEEGTEGEPGWLPPWGRLFDPDLCPAADLPYLGQLVGVDVPLGAPEPEARALVRAKAGISRGTRASVEAAIERSITVAWAVDTAYTKGQLVTHEPKAGELLCYEATANFTSGATFATTHLTVVNIHTQYELIPRERANGETNAYYFTVIVHGYQLQPEGNTAQLLDNINSVKPAGLVPEIVVTEEALATDPLISEFTLPIEAISGEIETLTLADVT